MASPCSSQNCNIWAPVKILYLSVVATIGYRFWGVSCARLWQKCFLQWSSTILTVTHMATNKTLNSPTKPRLSLTYPNYGIQVEYETTDSWTITWVCPEIGFTSLPLKFSHLPWFLGTLVTNKWSEFWGALFWNKPSTGWRTDAQMDSTCSATTAWKQSFNVREVVRVTLFARSFGPEIWLPSGELT